MNLYERENQMVLDNKGFEEFAPKIINYTTNFKREESRDKVLVLRYTVNHESIHNKCRHFLAALKILFRFYGFTT